MAEFQHIVMTRFNLRLMAKRGVDKQNRSVLTDEWMDQRFALFTQFCLPSMVGQTCKDYIWLIYFDLATDEKYRQRIDSLLSGHSNFIVKYIDSNTAQSFVEQVQSDVKPLLQESTELLVTTRLDNDDSLHRRAVERIQQEVAGPNLGHRAATFKRLGEEINGIAINFNYGYQLQIGPHYELASSTNSANPFMSLVEKVSDNYNFKSVWATGHRAYLQDKCYQMWQIKDGRYWLQIVHDTNLLNDMDGYPSLQVSELAEFSIDTAPIHLSKTRFLQKLMLWLWRRSTQTIKLRIKSIARH